MKKTVSNIIAWIKRHKIKSILIAIVLIIVILIATKKPAPEVREYVTVAPTTVSQEVDVTGKIEAAVAVSLSVGQGGKVTAIPATVGNKVTKGQTLLVVQQNDLQVRLARQRATLEKAKITLAQREPRTTASDSLAKSYEEGLSGVAEVFTDTPSILAGIDQMLENAYLNNNTVANSYSSRIIAARSDAVRAYKEAKETIDTLDKKYKTVSRDADPKTIEATIDETYAGLRKVSDAVKAINTLIDQVKKQQTNDYLATDIIADQSVVTGYTNKINRYISTTLSISTEIKNSHKDVVSETYDLDSIRLDIRQAELDIQDTLVQIGNRIIRAPIDGVVTQISAKVGETLSASMPAISVMSQNKFQITANVSESDIAKITVGDSAEIVLDAYGSDVVFAATVVAIDPAETVLDGVATYKTTLQLTQDDERIKSGMTADVSIKGESKDNVLAVPQRAVTTKDGTKYVKVLNGELVEDRAVQTGLRGSDGNIEITSGLAEGEQVVVFTEKKK